MNSLASMVGSMEIQVDVNPSKTLDNFLKSGKWFDKAKFDNFCRRFELSNYGGYDLGYPWQTTWVVPPGVA